MEKLRVSYNLFIKLWMFITFISFSYFSYSFAVDTISYDCWLAKQPWESLEKDVIEFTKDFQILKVKEVEVAHQNLKTYCCEKQYISEESCSGKWDVSKIPEWRFLVEHLIDIGFRKLDWDKERMPYSVSLDPRWQEYRKQIKEEFAKLEWDDPAKFMNMYNEFWKDIDSKDSLAYKYRQVCDEADKIYLASLNIYSGQPNSKFRDLCEKMATYRINKEVDYVKNVMVLKWAKYIENNIKDYLITYFSNDRLQILSEKLVEVLWKFRTVFKKSGKRVDTCNVGW